MPKETDNYTKGLFTPVLISTLSGFGCNSIKWAIMSLLFSAPFFISLILEKKNLNFESTVIEKRIFTSIIIFLVLFLLYNSLEINFLPKDNYYQDSIIFGSISGAFILLILIYSKTRIIKGTYSLLRIFYISVLSTVLIGRLVNRYQFTERLYGHPQIVKSKEIGQGGHGSKLYTINYSPTARTPKEVENKDFYNKINIGDTMLYLFAKGNLNYDMEIAHRLINDSIIKK